MRVRIALALIAASGWACGDAPDPIGGADASVDMEPSMDGGSDAGASDQGASDVGGPDGGDTDMGAVDMGMQVDCSQRPGGAPDLRSEASLVHDPVHDRLLMFGGNVAEVMCPGFSREPSGELWAFELDCNNWRRIEADGAPPARVRHAVTVDTRRNRMLLFGGRQGTGAPYTMLDDVWAFDLEAETWSRIEASAGPTPRDDTILQYDAARDRVLLFGGDTDTGGLLGGRQGDLWALNLADETWVRLTPDAPRPPARLLHASALLDDRLLVFGGAQDFLNYLNDLWILDLTTDTWRQVSPGGGGAPRNRFGPSMFIDSVIDRAFVFAGHDDLAFGNRNDTWDILLGPGIWTEIRTGDQLNPDAPEPGQCDFPPDWTIPDLDVPDRRSAFPYTQTETHAFVFGGNTDCGRANDVWMFEFATERWSELRAANGGISCPHSGQANCTTLCF